MQCGIHQGGGGGYLSLVKYISFIDSLLTELKDSKLCCSIDRLQASPVSYADDLAAACVAKCNVDGIMQTAYRHSCKWRYRFNIPESDKRQGSGMDAIRNHDLCKKGYFSEDNFSNGRAVDL